MSEIAVITGARSGLGKALDSALSAYFIPRIAITRTPLADAGVRNIVADLRHPHDWPAKLAPILSQLRFKRLWFFDIAAVLPQGELLSPGFGTGLEEALQVNVLSPLAIAGALADHADAVGAQLDIVHTTSGAARRAIPRWGAYCASKAVAAMNWEVLASENPRITAHICHPGVIATDMQAQLRKAGDENAARPDALRAPQEVAADILVQCGIAQKKFAQ